MASSLIPDVFLEKSHVSLCWVRFTMDSLCLIYNAFLSTSCYAKKKRKRKRKAKQRKSLSRLTDIVSFVRVRIISKDLKGTG